tara:strand:- start:320 stop:757 length:438 start_codon:yes stop_codon:yes gene_type:complete
MSWKSISKSKYSQLLGTLETNNKDNKDYYRMTVGQSHLNAGNFAHGGFLMSFLDNVMGNAAYKSFNNNPCVTISMSTHFTQSASLGDELIGQPIIEKKTNTLSFVKCQVFSNNNLIVSGSGIWKIVNFKKNKNVSDKIKLDDGGW